MGINVIIGSIGAFLVLVAYGLNQSGKWNQDTFDYDLLNFLGSALLAVYAVTISSWPFFIINFAWASASFRDLVDAQKKRIESSGQ